MNNLKVLMRISGDPATGFPSTHWKVDTGFRKADLLEEEAEIVAEKLAEAFSELHDAKVHWRVE